MRIIKPTAIELKQTNLFKHIELCGRTCYKSEDKITEDSCHKFVDMLKKHAHGAMLEHGTVYLTIPKADIEEAIEYGKIAFDVVDELKSIQMMRLSSLRTHPLPHSKTISCGEYVYITTNYRVIVERDIEFIMNKYQTEPTEHHIKRRTFKITCNRGVSHEFVRHRVFSFAQESQRYCNYSKDKYGKEITFIEPIWHEGLSQEPHKKVNIYDWMDCMETCERTYFYLLESGLTPQLARGVLPNDIKTELIMTGFESDWEHFFKLRCANDAHPEAKYIADMIKEMF